VDKALLERCCVSLGVTELARRLGCSPVTVWRWRKRGTVPMGVWEERLKRVGEEVGASAL